MSGPTYHFKLRAQSVRSNDQIRFEGVECKVQHLFRGCRFWIQGSRGSYCLGFRVWNSGFGFYEVEVLGSRVDGAVEHSGSRLGCRVWGLGFMVSGSWFVVHTSWFMVYG